MQQKLVLRSSHAPPGSGGVLRVEALRAFRIVDIIAIEMGYPRGIFVRLSSGPVRYAE
jgi:hypothetical protein